MPSFLMRPVGNTGLTGARLIEGAALGVAQAGVPAGDYDYWLLTPGVAPVTVEGPPATVTPVLFDGANDYLHLGALADRPRFTLVMGMRLQSQPDNFDLIWHTGYSHLRFLSGRLNLGLLRAGSGTAVAEFHGNPTIVAPQRLNIMLSMDVAGSLKSGTSSVVLWLNGSELYSVDGTVASNWDFDVTNCFAFRAGLGDAPSNFLEAEVDFIWMANEALEPATIYGSAFFNPDLTSRALPTDGIIGGVTPFFFENRMAAGWNSNVDARGNAKTLIGAVTDVTP